MLFKPTGSVIQLMDGRIFKKNQKNQNLWENINSGVMITEQQLNLMITSASFSADASGGGNTRRETPPDPDPVVSLSAPFDDIVASTSDNTFNANRTITTTAPVTLRLTFSAGGTYVSSAAIVIYKNDVYLDQVRSQDSPPSPKTLSETFANGDQLKFSASINSTALRNFDVTIEKISPGTVQVVDTFNISSPAS